MIHKMNLQDSPFKMIKDKEKTVELRLYDEKRRKIKVGDKIIFDNANTNETITVEVLKLHIYKDFYELYKHFDKKTIGYKENEIKDPKDMEEYYSKDKIEKYGVVGIEIKVID